MVASRLPRRFDPRTLPAELRDLADEPLRLILLRRAMYIAVEGFLPY
ncbi:hypothetical protein [Planomonospora venezuelensis]|uniref:Uncharacterized protein n=1 Tax=Planomonospora venezuelensis TaxID=1999 RepID=A0A841DHF3_PLAVE|nr:hypothetical protein [Planomonospora venezuelensis]MBB5967525.1 hypothetical protein [Planomonospora venezuelensis]GIN04805.1 hypothetical protein Pve01_64630 [Planomonospora venezuelensis]